MTRRIALLVVAPYVPVPNALHGGGRATATWIRALSETCSVDLICLGGFGDEARARAAWPALREVEVVPFRSGWQRAVGLLSDVLEGRRARGVRARLRERVRERLAGRRYDTLLVEHEEMALWLDLERGPVRLALDCHDVISSHFDFDPAANPLPEGLKNAERARAAEAHLLTVFDAVATRSRADFRRLAAIGGPARLELLRHPIELPATRQPRAARQAGEVLLTGSFRRETNVVAARLAIERIWPLVMRALPAARLWVVGDEADRALENLAGRPGVSILGRQPDLTPFYQRAQLFLNPIQATGGVITRHLEALAAGLPVVTTRAGAVGLDIADGVVQVESPTDAAGAVIGLLGDERAWDALASAGYASVRQLYGAEPWAAVLTRFVTPVAGQRGEA